MSDATYSPEQGQWTLKGWHILAALIAFFSVIISVNMFFLTMALNSFSGIETSDAYRKGLAYNSRITEQRRVEERGWSGAISTTDARVPVITLTRVSGAPLTGMAVTGKIGRPTTDKFDRSVSFIETRDGAYHAVGVTLEPGRWVMTAVVSDPVASNGTVPMRLKERLWVSQ